MNEQISSLNVAYDAGEVDSPQTLFASVKASLPPATRVVNVQWQVSNIATTPFWAVWVTYSVTNQVPTDVNQLNK